MALVTKTRSPQTIGLECASPGIGVRHSTCSPVAGFQVSGRFCCSAMPDGVAPAERRPVAGAARGAECARGRPRPSGRSAARPSHVSRPAAAIGCHREWSAASCSRPRRRRSRARRRWRSGSGRAQAVLRSGGDAEGHFASAAVQSPAIGGQPCARQREGAGRIKLQREVANHERP